MHKIAKKFFASWLVFSLAGSQVNGFSIEGRPHKPSSSSFVQQAVPPEPTHFPWNRVSSQMYQLETDISGIRESMWDILDPARKQRFDTDINHLNQMSIVLRPELFKELTTVALDSGLLKLTRKQATVDEKQAYVFMVQAYLDFLHFLGSSNSADVQRIASGETIVQGRPFPFMTVQYASEGYEVQAQIIFQEHRQVGRLLLLLSVNVDAQWVELGMIRIGADGRAIDEISRNQSIGHKSQFMKRLLHLDMAPTFPAFLSTKHWVHNKQMSMAFSHQRHLHGIAHDFAIIIRSIKMRMNQLPARNDSQPLDVLNLHEPYSRQGLTVAAYVKESNRLDMELLARVNELADTPITRTTDFKDKEKFISNVLRVIEKMERYAQWYPDDHAERMLALSHEIRSQLDDVIQLVHGVSTDPSLQIRQAALRQANRRIADIHKIVMAITDEKTLKVLTIAYLFKTGQRTAATELLGSLEPISERERQVILDAYLFQSRTPLTMFRSFIEGHVMAESNQYYEGGQFTPTLLSVLGTVSSRWRRSVWSEIDSNLRAYLQILAEAQQLKASANWRFMNQERPKPRGPGPNTKLMAVDPEGSDWRSAMAGVPSQAAIESESRRLFYEFVQEARVLETSRALDQTQISDQARNRSALSFAASNMRLAFEKWKQDHAAEFNSLAGHLVRSTLETLFTETLAPLEFNEKISPQVARRLKLDMKDSLRLMGSQPEIIFTESGDIDLKAMRHNARQPDVKVNKILIAANWAIDHMIPELVEHLLQNSSIAPPRLSEIVAKVSRFISRALSEHASKRRYVRFPKLDLPKGQSALIREEALSIADRLDWLTEHLIDVREAGGNVLALHDFISKRYQLTDNQVDKLLDTFLAKLKIRNGSNKSSRTILPTAA